MNNSMFLYDTGSPYTTVTNITCNETCMTNFYNPNISSTAVEGDPMDLMVNGVNMTGYLYKDAICLNSTLDWSCLDEFEFFVATSQNNVTNYADIDGTLGLAPPLEGGPPNFIQALY
jgi:hypothetical protein